jgi:hypothetical protein
VGRSAERREVPLKGRPAQQEERLEARRERLPAGRLVSAPEQERRFERPARTLTWRQVESA